MDVSYWIFFLIAYLVSQWLKKRSQVFEETTAEEKEDSSTTSKNEKNQIPEFIRNFGFEDLIDEIKPKIISKEESYTEFSEDTFDSEILEDDHVLESRIPQVDDLEEEEINERIMPKSSDLPKLTFSHPIQAYLNHSKGLKNAILIRDILGPPRAIERYAFRRFN
tara:strand:- start:49 stop:543 length:495 start_codon:yes stop_codon:yes gene_type:complete